MRVGVSLMVCMFSLGWTVPPIAYMLRSLNEIALVKTSHVAPIKPQFRFSSVLTKTAVFSFGNCHSTSKHNGLD